MLKKRLTAGLLESGADLVDLGIVPTPAFYFAIKQFGADGGVIVTASHNPAQCNGFKLALGSLPVVPEDILRIREMVEEGRFADAGPGTLRRCDPMPDYLAFLASLERLDGLTVVVDAANGCMSEAAPAAFIALGARVVRLFCQFDGTFPNRNPNPAVHSNLSRLSEEMRWYKADLGVAFDGDGDRVVFVDKNGKAVAGEYSLSIFVEEYLADKPAPVVYDLKSSSVVKKAILAKNGEPVMEKSGHAFIRRTFLQKGAALAGEISGHFFFGELGYDDGLYAALKMAAIIKRRGALAQLVAAFPDTCVSPDLRVRCAYAERDAVMQAVERFGCDTGAELSRLDGVRLEYPYGWLLVRKSVTEEAITLRLEADDKQAYRRIVTALVERLPLFSAAFE